MKKGKPINFFILVIEGRVEVNIGREELTFESGPFSYFGIQTLSQVLPSITSGLVVDRYFYSADLGLFLVTFRRSKYLTKPYAYCLLVLP